MRAKVAHRHTACRLSLPRKPPLRFIPGEKALQAPDVALILSVAHALSPASPFWDPCRANGGSLRRKLGARRLFAEAARGCG